MLKFDFSSAGSIAKDRQEGESQTIVHCEKGLDTFDNYCEKGLNSFDNYCEIGFDSFDHYCEKRFWHLKKKLKMVVTVLLVFYIG